MTFFERLQTIMRDMKWDQKSLSRQCGISEKTITRWKKTPNKVPSVGKLHEICEQSGYDLDWLMYGTGEPFPDQLSEEEEKAAVEAVRLDMENMEKQLKEHALSPTNIPVISWVQAGE